METKVFLYYFGIIMNVSITMVVFLNYFRVRRYPNSNNVMNVLRFSTLKLSIHLYSGPYTNLLSTLFIYENITILQ